MKIKINQKMIELTKQQQQAYKKLLNILQETGRQYVYTQGKNIEWFTINEIDRSPFYEIKYINETYVTVMLHTHENGYQEFVLKLHDGLCKKKIITQEINSYFFKKEIEVSSFVMECLNEMYKIKKGLIFGYMRVNDDKSPLSEFKSNF